MTAMKILSAQQIRQLDAYTIEHEPVASIDLMERASLAFTNWLTDKFDNSYPIHIICGPGNNGGDGLAIARLLDKRFYKIKVWLFYFSKKTTSDFEVNLERLKSKTNIPIHHIDPENDLPIFYKDNLIVDAILGSGLTRPAEGQVAEFIEHLNAQAAIRISIDIPSGLFADKHTAGKSIYAAHTFCFELPKLAFMFPQNESRVEEWTFKSIGLHPNYLTELPTSFHYLNEDFIKHIIKKRPKFSHKGTYGHALLIMGARGKTGAAILATKACLRSGVGLVTLHAPTCLEHILPVSIPEAMFSADQDKTCFTQIPELENYRTIGIGCGLGTDEKTQKALKQLLDNYDQPMVLDADALNIISQNKSWLKRIPKNSILTPHPKEFERLFGKQSNDFERNEVQVSMAQQYNIYIVLKGAHSCIACPNGNVYFNSTGNPGMATAGSGDVLAGMITGLLSQKYTPFEAAILGVYLHGLAGDFAAAAISQEAMIAGDIIDYLGATFQYFVNR